ncbi:alpha/beta hydrolase [Actinoallomurus purpureus]|uniref:alpha/beta fold hydrolase n=1 Tax=Actinoallomurus purpureus TaxID=478114 RepID=UPI00209254CA|nr:alpha/beta hydrolase [Actinoallomurus purpureus]MCO6010308.1 alpha/beta hydrolase [Actinoallomurus purpureus]
METRIAHTQSGDMAYVDAGEGRTAMFVHGVGTSSRLWRGVVEEFSAERRCVAIDLPLHGATPPRADYSLPALAQAIADLCVTLDLRDIDLVANDTGGAVAQVFAARHPERLRTFTLTNCDTHDNLPPEEFRPTVELAERGELAPAGPVFMADVEAARGVIGAGYEHPEKLDAETLRAFLEPVFGTPDRARDFERFLTSVVAADLLAVEPELRKLDIPTLVVWGTGDQFFDLRWAHWLRETIPGATEVVEIEGGKLFFPDERAADLIPHLRRHWAAH